MVVSAAIRPATHAAPPFDHPCLRVVTSFEALIATPFRDGVNAVCWPRDLRGDFDEVVQKLATADDITSIDEGRLTSLEVGPAGREAVASLLDDLRRLRAIGHDPSLDLSLIHISEPTRPY